MRVPQPSSSISCSDDTGETLSAIILIPVEREEFCSGFAGVHVPYVHGCWLEEQENRWRCSVWCGCGSLHLHYNFGAAGAECSQGGSAAVPHHFQRKVMLVFPSLPSACPRFLPCLSAVRELPEEAEWVWGCSCCGNCSYRAAFCPQRIIIMKSLMVKREKRGHRYPAAQSVVLPGPLLWVFRAFVLLQISLRA